MSPTKEQTRQMLAIRITDPQFLSQISHARSIVFNQKMYKQKSRYYLTFHHNSCRLTFLQRTKLNV